jgi:hypothetical protein
MKRGPLTFVSTIDWKSSGSGLENREYDSRDPSRWPCDTPLSTKVGTNFPDKWWSLRSVQFARSHGVKLIIIEPKYSLPCLHLHKLPSWPYSCPSKLLITVGIHNYWFHGETGGIIEVCRLLGCDIVKPTRRRVPEDGILHSYRRGNLKSYRRHDCFINCLIFRDKWIYIYIHIVIYLCQ